jgi:hypothetical protein
MQETGCDQLTYLKAAGHNPDCQAASREQNNKPLDTEEGRASGHEQSAKSDK